MQNTETNRIENKEQLNEDFEQEVIAFLNYKEGGIIYVGVRKDGQVVGLKDVDLTQLQIKDRIKNNIQPSTLGLFDVIVETIDDKEVIKVVISSGTEKPYYLRKKGRTPEGCYIRIGSSKERMTFDMIDEMYSKRVKNPLKEIESPRQDLTFRQLKIYYEENGMQLNDNFAKNLNLLTSEGKYNYNAYLLADENNVSIKLVKYLGTNKLELVENHEYGYCCIITATHRILERLVAENTVYAKIEYKGRKEVEMIDSKALKEAVINAIVHSDYTYNTSPIIELYSDRIEITSGGGLPQELSQEEFLEGVTAPRNKELIRVFKDVDLIENIGSGVLRILDAYDKSCFIFMDHFLRVSFKYKENPFEYDQKIDQESNQNNLNFIQNKILTLIKQNPKITQIEIAKILGVSREKVKYNIAILKVNNILERIGSNKIGEWKILK
ncbi:MAG: putative DNA binding domain-containing protein [Clostridia bacterium]|nr:putative DNA binding domain-containing protein [Clostridia bacterium]